MRRINNKFMDVADCCRPKTKFMFPMVFEFYFGMCLEIGKRVSNLASGFLQYLAFKPISLAFRCDVLRHFALLQLVKYKIISEPDYIVSQFYFLSRCWPESRVRKRKLSEKVEFV